MTYLPPKGPDNSIQFNDSGSFGGDSNFIWDSGNTRLGIGTDSPEKRVHVSEEGATALSAINVDNHQNGGTGYYPAINLRRNNSNSSGSFTATAANYVLGGLSFWGTNASSWKLAGIIEVVQEGATSTYCPNSMRLKTSDGTNVHETRLSEDGALWLSEIAAPGAPGTAGYGAIYAGTDDKLYYHPYGAGSPIDLTANTVTTPGGSAGYIQYNNGGFAGEAELIWDFTNNRLGIGTTSGTVDKDLHILGATPTIRIEDTTAAGQTDIYRDTSGFFHIGGAAGAALSMFQNSGAGSPAFKVAMSYTGHMQAEFDDTTSGQCLTSVAATTSDTTPYSTIIRQYSYNNAGSNIGTITRAGLSSIWGSGTKLGIFTTTDNAKIHLVTKNSSSEYHTALTVDGNQKVGIGTESPDKLLTLFSATEAKVKLNTSHESNYSEINFYRSEGGVETFGDRIDNGDILGKLSFTARFDDGVENAGEYQSAAIICQATEDWTTVNGGGTEILFSTTENDTGSQSTRMTIKDTGDVDFAYGITVSGFSGTPGAGAIDWDGSNFRGYNGASWVNLDVTATGTVDTSGTPANNYVANFTDSDTITGSADFTWDDDVLQLRDYTTSASNWRTLKFIKNNGSFAALNVDDIMGEIAFWGQFDDGVETFGTAPAARIVARVSEDFDGSGFGTALDFRVPNSGAFPGSEGADITKTKMSIDEEAVKVTHGANNGQSMNFKTATTTVSSMSGATATASNLIPAGAVLVGLSVRVTTAITGATSFDIGDGSDVDRWGSAIAIALNTTTDNTDWTSGTISCFPSAQDVVLTANGSNFTAGAVRITAHYIDCTAATS